MTTLSQVLEANQVQRPALKVALLYLVGITVAELLTALIEPRVGLLLHGILLLVVLLHTARSWDQPERELLLTLSFAPLIRLLSLSLPLGGFPLVYWYLITSVPLFASVMVAMRTLGFTLHTIGLTSRKLGWQVAVSATGLAFGLMEYQILRPNPLARALTWNQLLLPATILMVSTGFMEEVIFRGLMQRASTDTLGRFSVPYVAAIFAVLHVGYKSLLDVVFVFGVALFFGYVTNKTRSILGVSISHGLTNIVLFLVAPFLL
jgi:membrane protease YdiL (CAAX protease family)